MPGSNNRLQRSKHDGKCPDPELINKVVAPEGLQQVATDRNTQQGPSFAFSLPIEAAAFWSNSCPPLAAESTYGSQSTAMARAAQMA